MNADKSFAQRTLIVVLIAASAFLIVTLGYFIFDILLLVFSAILIAVFLRGTAAILSRYTKQSEGFLVFCVVLILLGLFIFGIVFLAPDVAEQVSHLRDTLPQSIASIRDRLNQFGWGRAILKQIPEPVEMWNQFVSLRMLASVGGFFSSTFGAIGNFFVLLMLAGYFAATPKYYAEGIATLFAIPRRPRVMEILATINTTLFWWLIGKTASMVFIGFLTTICLWALGVPMALALGVIAGLLSFIPNFGPIMSAIPALLIAFVESPWLALYTIGIYLFVQFVESWIVTPWVEQRTVELQPGVTIVFQLMLAVMVGGVGLIVATPLLAVIVVLVQMVYVEDVLGDRNTNLLPDEIDGESAAA